MKIGTICNLPPPFGGAECFAKELALRLYKKGKNGFIVTQKMFEIEHLDNILTYPYVPSNHLDILRQGIKIFPLFTSSFRKKFIKEAIENIDESLIHELQKVMSQEKPDLVHCHFTTGKIKEVLRVCKKIQVPLIVTLHGMTNLVPMYDSYVCGALTSEQIIELIRLCDHIIVVSRQMLNYCRENGLNNVSRIPTAINTVYFSPGGHVKRKGILYVGKFNKHKGLKETLEAFLKIKNVIKDNLYLVGRGITIQTFNKTGFLLDSKKKDSVLKLIKNGRIQLAGELQPNNIRELYRACKVLVLPSLTEGFPLVILEALSCGTPVIASNVGSISEIIRDGKNGYCIPVGNSEKLAEALVKQLGDFHSHLQNICRSSVDDYEIAKVTGEYKTLFRNILARGAVYD